MRDANASNPRNWEVVCSTCAATFGSAETIDLANGHFQTEHPDLENPHFNIIWVGTGPRPKGGHRRSGRPRRRRR